MARAPRNGDRASRRITSIGGHQPISRSTLFDRLAFVVGTAAAVWLAVIIALQGLKSWWGVLLLIVVWAIIAYLALPRLHRMLSDLYVPDYFFGRTRTGDGLLGDPVNLAVNGSFAQLDGVMRGGGWHVADDITAKSTWGIIVSTITRRSYPTAPVSPLFLFGRKQDVAYQQEVAGNPKQRHHVRFWRTPDDWLLPGGTRVDFLGAGTYDTDVGLSLFTLQITHRIDENTDVERDFVVQSASASNPDVGVDVLEDFTTGYHSRNGGGDRFITDGDLPILNLSRVRVGAAEARHITEEEHARKRPPLTIVLGVVALLFGAVISLIDLFTESTDVDGLFDDPLEQSIASAILWGILGVFVFMILLQVILAFLMLRGGRASRNALVILLTLSIVTVALSYAGGETKLQMDAALLNATIQCLALLAVTTESAGEWSRRTKFEKFSLPGESSRA